MSSQSQDVRQNQVVVYGLFSAAFLYAHISRTELFLFQHVFNAAWNRSYSRPSGK